MREAVDFIDRALDAAPSHRETDSPGARRWIEAEGKRREAAAIERFADDVENMLRAEVRAQKNDLVDELAARGVSADVRVLSFDSDEQRLMVCGCVWVGPDPSLSTWHQHLRLCGWVGRLPVSPWLDEAV